MNSGLNGKNKKGRGTIPPGRGNRGRMDRQPIFEGAYSNYRMLQTMGSLVGLNTQIQTKSKEIFEGVFSSLSSKFEIVLEYPHLITGSDSSVITNVEFSRKKMIFNRDDIVLIKMIAVDVDFANKESFAIDSAISSRQNGQVKGRALEPWENDDHETPDNMELEENENGWDAQDMFKKNEDTFGVQTTYKADMEGYTTPLPKCDINTEQRAQKVAYEIESSSSTHARAELENGQTEEERFSSVNRQETSKYNMAPKKKPYINKATSRAPQGSSLQQGYNRGQPNSPPRGGAYSGGQNSLPPYGGVHRHDSAKSMSHSQEEPEGEWDEEKSSTKNIPSNYSEPPKEQRKRFSKEGGENVVELKKFGKAFNLSDGPTDKGHISKFPQQKVNVSAALVRPVLPPQSAQPLRPPISTGSRQVTASTPQQSRQAVSVTLASAPSDDSHLHSLRPQLQECAESNSGHEDVQPKNVPALQQDKEDKNAVAKTNSILNPEAKPFTPRSAATPPPPPLPQHVIPGHQVMHPQMNFTPNMLSAAAYIVPQMQLSNPRSMQKRGALVGQQRADYSSQMQVANATGTPLLSQGPLANIPAVQLSPQMLQQNTQYPHYPLIMRYPGPVPSAMMTTMMPTSGVYPQADISQAQHLHGQQMFMSQGLMHHPAALAAQHPPQAHTPQSHNAGPLAGHNMPPNPAVSTGPTPSQSGVYGTMGGQTLGGHLPPHASLPTQSPHSSQYGGHGTIAGPQTVLMLPPQMQAPHFAPANTPHSVAGQIPASQYSTSSVVHFNHGPPVNYIAGAHGNQVMPIHHHNP